MSVTVTDGKNKRLCLTFELFADLKEGIDSLNCLAGRIKRECRPETFILFDSYLKQARTAMMEMEVEPEYRPNLCERCMMPLHNCQCEVRDSVAMREFQSRARA